MSSFIAQWFDAIGSILVESGSYLLVGFLIAGLLKVLLPAKLIYRHLGKDDFHSVAVASFFGVPIPLCSCSVIPTAIELKKNGASKGATTSFLISTPETGVDSIGVTWALMDPLMTIVRPLAALFTALGAGCLVNLFVRKGWDDSPAAEQSEGDNTQEDTGHDHAEHDHDHDHDHDEDDSVPRTPLGVLGRASNYAFGTLLDDLTPWFVMGFILSGLIAVLVPEGFFGETLPNGLPSMLAMLAIGAPMYVCATASTPVAAMLMAKGLDPGAALIFLLAGPATNIATMGVVGRFLGKRVLFCYLVSIAFFSLLLGGVVNELYTSFGFDPTQVALAQEEAPGALTIIGGVILGLLLLRSAWRIHLGAMFGRRLRALCEPLGFDPTGRPGQIAAGLCILAAWASTAATIVGPGEVGFRVRFGAVLDVWEEPGLYMHAPYPLERGELMAAARVEGVAFGFDYDERARGGPPVFMVVNRRDDDRNLEQESEVLTVEENLLSAVYSVHYRRSDAYRAQFAVADAQALVRAQAEACLRQAVLSFSTEELLVGHYPDLEESTAQLLQAEMEALNLGLEVVGVHVHAMHAPPEVHTAYRDVASALENKQMRLQRALEYEFETLSKARAEALATTTRATAESAASVQLAEAKTGAFRNLQQAHAEAPDLDKMRRLLDLQLSTMKRARIILPAAPDLEVVPLGPGASEQLRTSRRELDKR